MIEVNAGSTMFSGREATSFFRMKMQLSALKFKVQTGMELSRGHAILPLIEKEYGLKGNAAKVYEQFKALVDTEQEKQLLVVELQPTQAKVKKLSLKTAPDFVYWPVECHNGEGWKLGKVEPDVEGYMPTNRLALGTSKEAEAYCFKEAAARGINAVQVEAVVVSSMFPANYFSVLKVSRGVKS